MLFLIIEKEPEVGSASLSLSLSLSLYQLWDARRYMQLYAYHRVPVEIERGPTLFSLSLSLSLSLSRALGVRIAARAEFDDLRGAAYEL
jgi:hypothetical protein